MKKVLASASGIIFAVFGIAVLALLMSLTYGALQKLFPNSFSNQIWGLIMFDIAAMCWAIAFVFKSQTTIQYATAGLGFITAFLGTLGMVAAEVMLSGQSLAQTDTQQIGQWMIYGFIGVTAMHAALLYLHHAGAPDIHEKINVGIARGEITTEAINQATRALDTEKAILAQSIRNDIISQVKRDLGLMPVNNTIFDRRLSPIAAPTNPENQADGNPAPPAGVARAASLLTGGKPPVPPRPEHWRWWHSLDKASRDRIIERLYEHAKELDH